MPIFRSQKSLKILIPTLLVALTGCQTVQTTNPGVVGVDRKQSMSSLITSEQLNAQGAKAYNSVISTARSKKSLNRDPVQTKKIRAIAARLIPQTKVFREEALKWDWRINVIKDKSANAFCMPGGKIAVNTGLIDLVDGDQDMLAVVMGHEIAHALREHSREQAGRSVGSQILAIGVKVLTKSDTAAQAVNTGSQVGYLLPHNRKQETEADMIGLELMARAGYNPSKAEFLWKKMMQAAGGKKPPEFLSTHPSSKKRAERLRVLSKKVWPLYQAALKKRKKK